MAHDVILMLFGGGFTVGVLEFIKFLIKLRTDQQNRREDRNDDTEEKIGNLREDMIKQMTESNAIWKTTYCDKNAEAISHLVSITKELKENTVLLTKATVEIKEYEKNVGGAINGIIHDRIMHNIESYIERGGITIDEVSTLKSMYNPYKKLGGNGDVETAYEKIANGTIPVITKEEAMKRDVLLQRKKIYGETKAKTR